MQYITFRLQTDCNQTFHPLSFSIKYALYFLYFLLPDFWLHLIWKTLFFQSGIDVVVDL